ncbi:class I SAM-dependent methyltransferase [Dubosiella newyorkensis]|uniref:class I SAM-dependent methyltransferase n=2 Tax=Dubosiella newyorkensis TaxID=1862672 RepID=UPI0023F36778|nr:methyltransferase [Dubosiella newyorkensis]
MAHYFTDQSEVEDRPFEIHFDLMDRSFSLRSNLGVFSKDKLDEGTRLLLENVLKEQEPPKNCLDLGCGIGVVSIVLKSFWDTKMTLIDVNDRALSLAKENMGSHHFEGEFFLKDRVDTGEYACIVCNPPIRIGKKPMYALLDSALSHLEQGGHLWIVIRKSHGAQSAIKHFEEQGCEVEKVDSKKGYWVLKITPGV